MSKLEDTLFQGEFYLSRALDCRTDDNRNALLRITHGSAAPCPTKAIVEAGHAAWNARNLEGVLDNYTDDLLYTSNAGGPAGQPLQAFGKSGLRAMLAPVLPAFETMTSIEHFKFADDIAWVRVNSFAVHKSTGLELSGTYRQIIHFRGFKICRLEEFHDAAKLNAFWQLLAVESAKPVPWRTD